jgi:large subunit ribosomal protein L18
MSRLVNITNFERRRNRVRAKISGTKELPRLSVFKSNKFIYAQLIDDDARKTIASFSSVGLKAKKKTDQAKEVGAGIAKKAQELGISKVVFDRSGYLYIGKVKLIADSAREAGLKF